MNLLNRINNYINESNFKIIIGINYVNIINYDLVLDFNSNIVSVKYKDKIIDIKGVNLVVNKMLKDEILILGNINNVNFR